MMAEGFAAQQVKDLKNSSRKKRLEIKERKTVKTENKEALSKFQKEEIKRKVVLQKRKEMRKSIVLFMLSIFATYFLLKILFSPFKEIL